MYMEDPCMCSKDNLKVEVTTEAEEDREGPKTKQKPASEKVRKNNQETEMEGSQVSCTPMRSKSMRVHLAPPRP
jgi:hypothetical protein